MIYIAATNPDQTPKYQTINKERLKIKSTILTIHYEVVILDRRNQNQGRLPHS